MKSELRNSHPNFVGLPLIKRMKRLQGSRLHFVGLLLTKTQMQTNVRGSRLFFAGQPEYKYFIIQSEEIYRKSVGSTYPLWGDHLQNFKEENRRKDKEKTRSSHKKYTKIFPKRCKSHKKIEQKFCQNLEKKKGEEPKKEGLTLG